MKKLMQYIKNGGMNIMQADIRRGIMWKSELMSELIASVPNKRMLEVVNFCAIKVGDEYFVLKDRYKGRGAYVTDYINEESLTNYKQIEHPHHRYRELLHKSILIDKRILSRRGLMAIIEYLESVMR